VLAAFEQLRDLCADPAAVEDALWWHDAVYDPTASHGENEHASALLALETGCSAETARLIELTAGHTVAADDANGAVVADCDLSILGASEERYARYAADVRAEYEHVADADWSVGRAALLRSFLERPRLFVTDRMHDKLDAAARRNLQWELATLEP
jgi:predicted metal-dependent HD superfamily phosphohydrolase